MKATLISLLALATAIQADTVLTVTDDFNAAVLDPLKWSVTDSTPATSFTHAGQRLNYIISEAPSADDFRVLRCVSVQPAYDKDWEVIVDVSNTSVRNTMADWSGVGLAITGAQNLDRYDEIFFELGDENVTDKKIFANFITDDVDAPELDAVVSGTLTTASLRVVFNATSKVFSLSVDRTGSTNGYQWEALTSYGIAGSGGDRNTDWQMSGDGVFNISCYGLSANRVISQGQMTFDNFRFTGEIASPPDGFSSAYLANKTFYGVTYDTLGGNPIDVYRLGFTISEFEFEPIVPPDVGNGGGYTIKDGAVVISNEGPTIVLTGVTADYLTVELRESPTEIEHARWYFDLADAEAFLADLTTLPNGSPSIDGVFDDWADIPSIGGGAATSSVVNILGVKYAIDDENVYFLIEIDRPFSSVLPSKDAGGWNRTLWVDFNDNNEFGIQSQSQNPMGYWFGNGYKDGGVNVSLESVGGAYVISGARLEGKVPWDLVRGSLPQFMQIKAEFGSDNPSAFNELEDDYNYSEVYRLFKVDGGLATDPAYIGWAAAASLVGPAANLLEDPFDDDVPNLLKFAFNLDASMADRRLLTPDHGTEGLPYTHIEGAGANRSLVIEYIRRRNTTLQYIPQFCTDFGSWSAVSSVLAVDVIDSEWERVKVTHPAGGSNNAGRRFGRVVVEAP